MLTHYLHSEEGTLKIDVVGEKTPTTAAKIVEMIKVRPNTGAGL
jgi:cyclophilin family peptidyl-prolyl cis-trans isomerase